jgi:hypothetical protein
LEECAELWESPELKEEKYSKKIGGAYRDRTDDLNAASVALSQLS